MNCDQGFRKLWCCSQKREGNKKTSRDNDGYFDLKQHTLWKVLYKNNILHVGKSVFFFRNNIVLISQVTNQILQGPSEWYDSLISAHKKVIRNEKTQKLN